VLFTADAHRDNGNRFIVTADEKLTTFLNLKESHAMTLIEMKPHRNGWKVFEAPGVEPVFPEKDHAINYAQSRATLRCSLRNSFNNIAFHRPIITVTGKAFFDIGHALQRPVKPQKESSGLRCLGNAPRDDAGIMKVIALI
jgi:hypothetical protein